METQHFFHERRREALSRKEAYLSSFNVEWQRIHQGCMPEIGLKKAGHPERKNVCEDVKLKNVDEGLFLVVDGVSLSQGWLASREAARTMHELLGQRFDTHIENLIQTSLARGKDPRVVVTRYALAEMVSAVAQANSRIQALATRLEIGKSSTTLSLSKLVAIPDLQGRITRRLFYLNIGDSRIYLQKRDHGLEQVTQDDNDLKDWIRTGDLTPEEARLIDQIDDPRKLPDRLKPYTRALQVIYKSVGDGDPTKNLEVRYVDLQPGDRLVILTDGVSDQFPTEDIQPLIDHASDDADAEKRIQETAMRRALDGRHPRAKGDDISALVHTIIDDQSVKPHREHETKIKLSFEELQMRLSRYRDAQDRAQARVRELETALSAFDPLTPKREKISLLIQREEARVAEAKAAYHFERIQLEILDLRAAPRFRVGDRVHLLRKDFNPPSFDRQLWTIMKYDPDSKMYEIGTASNVRQVSRYELETMQPDVVARIGDELPIMDRQGRSLQGFRVASFDRDGSVVLARQENGGSRRAKLTMDDAREALFMLLGRAEQSRRRMQHWTQASISAQKNISNLQEQLGFILRIEAGDRSISRANYDG